MIVRVVVCKCGFQRLFRVFEEILLAIERICRVDWTGSIGRGRGLLGVDIEQKGATASTVGSRYLNDA